MVEEFGISNDTVCTIVREDLGKWKICSWFVMKVGDVRSYSRKCPMTNGIMDYLGTQGMNN